MHPSVMEFAQRILTRETVTGRTVLEVGSHYVNGSVRPHVTGLGPTSYTGIDIEAGEGVDVVMDCTQLHHFGRTWDLVISTEMLEHAQDWRGCITSMANAVAPGGLLLITTRSPGFYYHNPPDYWRYTPQDMTRILEALDLVAVTVEDDPFPEHQGVFVVATKAIGAWNPKPEKLADIPVAPVPRWVRDTASELGNGEAADAALRRIGGKTVEGQKLVVAFPLYRQVPVAWLFQWLGMEKDHIVGTVGTEAIYLPMAMRQLVDMAYQSCPNFDRVVFYEHDMIPPQNAFNRIAQYGEEHDVVGTMYFKHQWPYHIMAWMQVQPPLYSPLTAEVCKEMYETPALYEVDGVAMGFTSVSRRVFDQWDRSISMWDPTPPLIGHDLHFCNEAKKQGFKVFLDSGIGCGHLTQIPIGYGHSQEALAEADPPRWSENGVLCPE